MQPILLSPVYQKHIVYYTLYITVLSCRRIAAKMNEKVYSWLKFHTR